MGILLIDLCSFIRGTFSTKESSTVSTRSSNNLLILVISSPKVEPENMCDMEVDKVVDMVDVMVADVVVDMVDVVGDPG